MYLTFLSHFNIFKQVDALRDVYSENILVISQNNVGIKTVLIVIQNFGIVGYIFDMWRKITVTLTPE
jgi:hypothetical protein